MHCSFNHLPYNETGYFSKLATDYVSGDENIKPFIQFAPGKEGILQAIEERNSYPIDRKTLVKTLNRQYASLTITEGVEKNISLLQADTTFTICTAHQPNLLTGYLYFVYKIIHAIKLAAELKSAYPAKDFVPVYYMGSEDNDLDELGVFNYQGKKWQWDAAGQTGAVGRMQTASLKPLLQQLFKLLGPPGENLDSLQEILTKAYLEHKTIAAATRYLVNELFGRYGLIILDPDDAAFKKPITGIIKDDLLHQHAHPLVTAQAEKLEVHYKAQAHPRLINLFYLHDGIRNRIEKTGDKWTVVNHSIEWTEAELMAEVDTNPDRFSPNVILRGLLQESILPNVAFIGGGAEVAYWMQLRPVFEYYKVFYPVILLRQSVLWIHEKQVALREKAELSVADIFKDEATLIRQYMAQHSNNQWQTSEEMAAMEDIIAQLRKKATSLDATLSSSAEAALAKIKRQVHVLETKMLRAEKKKMQVELGRITRLKESVFPNNSLQERTENFIDYYLAYGRAFFDILFNAFQPFKGEFLVVEENNFKKA